MTVMPSVYGYKFQMCRNGGGGGFAWNGGSPVSLGASSSFSH
jgi:hypothetical protein